MNRFKEFFSLLIIVALFCACDSDRNEPVLDGDTSASTEQFNTCKMHFNGIIDDYDGQTRATTGYTWANGDKLFIRFNNEEKYDVCGFATYSTSTKDWTVSYAGSLEKDKTLPCEVYFFTNYTADGYYGVQLTANSAIYVDSIGSYSVSGGTINLSAKLEPKTARLRFISANTTKHHVFGLGYYNSFDLESDEFTYSSERMDLTYSYSSTATDGFSYSTDYIYGFIDYDNLSILSSVDDGVVYQKSSEDMLLEPGVSAYLTTPSTAVNKGWSVYSTVAMLNVTYEDLITDGDISGSADDYSEVDYLGLSVKWGLTNVGATTTSEYGTYYVWADPYGTVSPGNYASGYSSYSYISGLTNYDAAAYNWGNGWRMPTTSEVEELANKCIFRECTYNGVDGLACIGVSDITAIFFPYSGYQTALTSYSKRGSSAFFWTGDYYYSSSNYAYCFYSANSDKRSYVYKKYAMPIRPVKDK